MHLKVLPIPGANSATFRSKERNLSMLHSLQRQCKGVELTSINEKLSTTFSTHVYFFPYRIMSGVTRSLNELVQTLEKYTLQDSCIISSESLPRRDCVFYVLYLDMYVEHR